MGMHNAPQLCWLDCIMTINKYVHYVGHFCARNESLSISFESFRMRPHYSFPRLTTDLIAILLRCIAIRLHPFVFSPTHRSQEVWPTPELLGTELLIFVST
jgi:hypothetical protein